MNLRTDLIGEIKARQPQEISGVESYEKNVGEVTVSTVEIKTCEAASVLQKPCGRYCTVQFGRLDTIADTGDIIKAIVDSLENLMPTRRESVLVVGLGNTDITPDALGPLVADAVLATRHISGELKSSLGLEQLKNVSCLIPGVLGKTGIESYDLILAAVEKTKPDAVIAIDALAAASAKRLCKTVQLSDSGISPGSGVNNSRKELSEKTLHIPVVCIGIPTVIDVSGHIPDTQESMMVTPKDIDLLIEKSSALLSRAINIFLQPDLDEQILDSLT